MYTAPAAMAMSATTTRTMKNAFATKTPSAAKSTMSKRIASNAANGVSPPFAKLPLLTVAPATLLPAQASHRQCVVSIADAGAAL